jgi:UDP-N-acetylglucosamine 2-epimerase (non-hydrolysing)
MILLVVGARPNFVKMAPIALEFQRQGIGQVIIYTGQHYDERMSDIFIEELGMPSPNIHLGVGPASPAVQTGKIMTAFDDVCVEYRPQLVVVAGDVNSTLACALVAAQRNIPVAHVEAGLRSGDRSMPEEINRILTDHVSELLFTTEPSGERNLKKEGIPHGRIHFVGNSMIDSLRAHLDGATARRPWERYGLKPGHYAVATFHRPSNVDDLRVAREIAQGLCEVGRQLPVIFPAHPRVMSNSNGVWKELEGVEIIDPLGYVDFLGLLARARVVITDSGGIQEETTVLGVPCITVRYNTERPVTLSEGTNHLVEPVGNSIARAVLNQLKQRGRIPALWDGHAGERIVSIIETWLNSASH